MENVTYIKEHVWLLVWMGIIAITGLLVLSSIIIYANRGSFW